MQVTVGEVRFCREGWTLCADAVFDEGVHLITGDVGSGKTTLALILAGMMKPASGRVIHEGLRNRTLSMQFPEYHVTANTVRGEVRSWGLDPSRILPAEQLDGREDDDPLKLSRGELKRLHLACLFAKQWDLLVLDEPFSSLDCVQKQQVCRRLESLNRGVVILLTHEQAILPRVDVIWEMEEGRLVRRGRVPGAFSRWRGAPPYLAAALAAGASPANVRIDDVEEAVCRMHD